MPKFDVLVAGELNPDLILTGDVVPAFDQTEKLVDTATLVIGSSSAIFACGAARLGLQVAFVGVCGDDVWGHFMLTEMQKRTVDVSRVLIHPAGQTGLSIILNRHADRAILTHLGLIAALRAEDLPDELLRQARHLHVASYFLQMDLQAGLPALFQRAQALGLTTSLDTNYDPSEQWRGFDDLLAATDIFLPNAAEAQSLTGSADIETAATRLESKVKTTAIKLGAEGAFGVSAVQRIRVSSIPVNVVDTVGAGDSFDAGFIYGHLQNWPLEKCLRLAAVCGALSTQQAGGTAAQPVLAETLRFL